MEAAPRLYRYVEEVRFADVTDFCCSWTSPHLLHSNDLKALLAFLHYCFQRGFSRLHRATDLRRSLKWRCYSARKEPLAADDLERFWEVLDGTAEPWVEPQTVVFFYLLRYSGMSLAHLVKLEKCRVVGNRILSHGFQMDGAVWNLIPEWLSCQLQDVPHDSGQYFFWNGVIRPDSAARTWHRRVRHVLSMAGLPHWRPHHFTDHFAIDHLLHGTTAEEVARLLGYRSIRHFLRSYGSWVKKTQDRLEGYQRAVWQTDALQGRMTALMADKPTEAVVWRSGTGTGTERCG